MGDPKRSKKATSKIQSSLDQAMEERRRTLYKKRLEIARQGFSSYKNQNTVDAAQAFETYIRILEDWKKVGKGGLKKSLFDPKTEKKELNLLSGVYWDLAKLYDRTRTPDKLKVFRHYLQQHVNFSLDTDLEGVAAEGVRKYLSVGSPNHRAEFRSAYNQLTRGKKCFVATALEDVSHPKTLPRLRDYRDSVLDQRFLGRVFVNIYYRIGPYLASGVKRLPRFARVFLARRLDSIAERWAPHI